MSDRSSLLNDTGDSSQFFIWGVVSFILHIFVVAGMFYLPELNIPEIKPSTVVTIDLSTMPSLEPPAKKKGSLPKASPEAAKPAAESGTPVEKEEPAPKGDIEKAPPPTPEPEPKKETPPPKEPPAPEPKPKVEEKKPKEAPKEDVISTKPKKEDKKDEKKEPKEEKPSEVKDDKKEAKKDTKDDKTSPEKEPVDKDSKDKEPKKDGKVGEKDGSEKLDALARMRKKAALKAAASKAAAGDGEGDGGEEGDPRGSEKGSIHGVLGGSEKASGGATVDAFYLHEIGRYLAKNWIFSDALKGDKGLEACVVLKILPDGTLKEPPFFEKRSGNSYFDDTVYRTVMKSIPLPVFPQGIKEAFVTGAYRFTPDGVK